MRIKIIEFWASIAEQSPQKKYESMIKFFNSLHGYNIINRGTSSIVFSMWQFVDCLVYVELYNDRECEFKFI